MTDLAKLKELAEAAGSQTPPAFWTDGAGERERTWSEFYANANPAAILALISRLEEAVEALEDLIEPPDRSSHWMRARDIVARIKGGE